MAKLFFVLRFGVKRSMCCMQKNKNKNDIGDNSDVDVCTVCNSALHFSHVTFIYIPLYSIV